MVWIGNACATADARHVCASTSHAMYIRIQPRALIAPQLSTFIYIHIEIYICTHIDIDIYIHTYIYTTWRLHCAAGSAYIYIYMYCTMADPIAHAKLKGAT